MSALVEAITAKPLKKVEPGRPRLVLQVGRVIAYAVLIAYSVLVFVPFLWSVVTSFKTLPDSLRLTFVPDPFTLAAYTTVFTQLNPNVAVLFFNSVLIAFLVTVTNLFLGALGGYAFARLRFPGRELMFLAVLATLMIPDQLRLVPVYQILTALHLITPSPENYFGLVLILAISGTNLFIMRQFFLTIPFELEEAAKLDGAGLFTIFWRIVLPLSRPALAAVAILSFQGTWNGFFWPLVILQTPSHWTLPLGLAQFNSAYSHQWPPLMAVTVIATIPIAVLYVFFSRYFVGGLVSAAVKG